MNEVSPLDAVRSRWHPDAPEILRHGARLLEVRERETATAGMHAATIRASFPHTCGRPALELARGRGVGQGGPLTVGVVLSGGQAPGGHNVIAGVFDALIELHPASRLVGFLEGPRGVMQNRHRLLSAEEIGRYRNLGGFDLIGSGRDKIEQDAQLAAARETCLGLGLDGLVIVGGDDSNTNAAVLAEYFTARGDRLSVLGVPKTIDGDLMGGGIEVSFGFDTATRVYASLIGNICRDVASARKYWHFIRLMGRSASHVTLECALAARPNVALIAEEVRERGMTLEQVVEYVAAVVRRRADAGRPYGVCLVPEGLIEFIPEVGELIRELNRILADEARRIEAAENDGAREALVAERLSPAGARVFATLPGQIRRQLLIDRDAHGNVQVSKIDTEQLLAMKVAARAGDRFKVQSHFFGYEGRAANPTNFDASYTYALGRVASLLVAAGRTGYLCTVGNLAARPAAWTAGAVPLTSLMRIEERRGRQVPVIAKALVQTDGPAFRAFAARREQWQLEDGYRFPGAIQYFGPPSVTSVPPCTLLLARTGSDDPPGWCEG
jgi:pyrophosphate--fructose-6-phosphate 1-phosphotransferase